MSSTRDSQAGLPTIRAWRRANSPWRGFAASQPAGNAERAGAGTRRRRFAAFFLPTKEPRTGRGPQVGRAGWPGARHRGGAAARRRRDRGGRAGRRHRTAAAAGAVGLRRGVPDPPRPGRLRRRAALARRRRAGPRHPRLPARRGAGLAAGAVVGHRRGARRAGPARPPSDRPRSWSGSGGPPAPRCRPSWPIPSRPSWSATATSPRRTWSSAAACRPR